MIITFVYNNEIDVYHANWYLDNKVTVARWTTTQFYNRFSKFQNAQVPHL